MPMWTCTTAPRGMSRCRPRWTTATASRRPGLSAPADAAWPAGLHRPPGGHQDSRLVIDSHGGRLLHRGRRDDVRLDAGLRRRDSPSLQLITFKDLHFDTSSVFNESFVMSPKFLRTRFDNAFFWRIGAWTDGLQLHRQHGHQQADGDIRHQGQVGRRAYRARRQRRRSSTHPVAGRRHGRRRWRLRSRRRPAPWPAKP